MATYSPVPPSPTPIAEIDLDDVLLTGKSVTAQITQAIETARVEQTIQGASTVHLTLYDTELAFLNSGLLHDAATLQLTDEHLFALVAVIKQGRHLTVTFEDAIVAALRRKKGYRKADRAKITRAEFIFSLLREVTDVPWRFYCPLLHKRQRVARSPDVAKAYTFERKVGEDSWTCIQRLATEVGWRFFVVGEWVSYAPETDLIGASPRMVIDDDTAGVEDVAYDYPAGGKVPADATVTGWVDLWDAPPGSAIRLENLGPANGAWLVNDIDRNLFRADTTITLKQPQPVIPEPAPAPVEKPTTLPLATSAPIQVSAGYQHPLHASWTLTGKFGESRPGHLHAGIDMACPTGTPIYAVSGGKVVTAGSFGGYGLTVDVQHTAGVLSRYGHMSSIGVHVGQTVQAGQQIGRVGATGDATGPHLHFEVHRGSTVVCPGSIVPDLKQYCLRGSI